MLGKACLTYVNLDLGYYCADLFIKRRNSTDNNKFSIVVFNKYFNFLGTIALSATHLFMSYFGCTVMIQLVIPAAPGRQHLHSNYKEIFVCAQWLQVHLTAGWT